MLAARKVSTEHLEAEIISEEIVDFSLPNAYLRKGLVVRTLAMGVERVVFIEPGSSREESALYMCSNPLDLCVFYGERVTIFNVVDAPFYKPYVNPEVRMVYPIPESNVLILLSRYQVAAYGRTLLWDLQPPAPDYLEFVKVEDGMLHLYCELGDSYPGRKIEYRINVESGSIVG